MTEDEIAQQGFDVHEALMAWLRVTYPRVHPLAVVTACSYEIGRLVGQLTEGVTAAERDAMLDGVREVMRAHLEAYQRGLRR
jgi:hypothetical protein